MCTLYYYNIISNFFIILYRLQKSVTPFTDCFSIGKLHALTDIDVPSNFVLPCSLSECKKFCRASINNITLHSRQYSTVKSRNTYTISYTNPESGTTAYGQIEYLFSTTSVFAVIQELVQLEFPAELSLLSKWIVPVEVAEKCILLNSIINKCVYIHFSDCKSCCMISDKFCFD